MTPFNLERAKAGDPVVTRDGRPWMDVREFQQILADSIKHEFPITYAGRSIIDKAQAIISAMDKEHEKVMEQVKKDVEYADAQISARDKRIRELEGQVSYWEETDGNWREQDKEQRAELTTLRLELEEAKKGYAHIDKQLPDLLGTLGAMNIIDATERASGLIKAFDFSESARKEWAEMYIKLKAENARLQKVIDGGDLGYYLTENDIVVGFGTATGLQSCRVIKIETP